MASHVHISDASVSIAVVGGVVEQGARPHTIAKDAESAKRFLFHDEKGSKKMISMTGEGWDEEMVLLIGT
ncbi:hypothetical protein OsI_30618 [Oryza sativa Indica Group]|uniref:Uncharacterized protein n=1 Tax=Oryza sativa subsp. indica TaxID=39946 RepID=A2YZ51_ORYSI|nr:hypothetical protein OsI_30618 [Oryza sativa Indica Group]